MSVLIKLRRGTSSSWTSQNIVLASGEPGYETNTGRFKIGNGTTAWNSLPYASVIPSGLIAGSGVNINLGTNGSTATISVSGLNSSYISDFNEAVDDRIGTGLFIAGTGINLNYNDAGNTLTISTSGVPDATALVTNVFNKTGSPIPKFSVVYINGGQGDQPTIGLAIANGELTSSKTYGITAEAIGNMSAGKVIVNGSLTGLNTDQFNPTAPVGDVNGTILYLSPSVSGGVTKTKPSAPNHLVAIGTIVRTHQNQGVVEVRIQNGFELEELHNVAISGVSNNQAIIYNSTSGLWTNTTLTSSLISDFNEAVDDRVGSGLFVAGTGINLSYNDSGNSFTVSVTGLVNNPANNRILTSRDSSSTGIDAESYLTFNGDNFTVGNNSNNGSSSTIAGGGSNTIASGAAYNFIGGGSTNTINSWGYNAIVGGIANTINSGLLIFNFIGCGNSNTIRAGDRSFIGGGSFIAVSGNDNSIVGGGGHLASGIFNFIGGGSTNRIINSAGYSVIPGGRSNLIQTSGSYSSIVGGSGNTINTNFSTIVGGVSNIANHNNVFILGSNITSTQADTTYVQNLIASATGNFNTLQVNGTGVSISGHTHTASQITDFNEAVDDRIGSIGSGLFVAGTGINLTYDDSGNSFTVSVTGLISSPGNNRILTSRDSTSTGIDAESSFTYDGSRLTIGSNTNSGVYSNIMNGSSNTINAVNFATILNGFLNTIGSGSVASPLCVDILGGSNNTANGDRITICGGAYNTATNNTTFNPVFIGGGILNSINANSINGSIVGGYGNSIASGLSCFIGGGKSNAINSDYSSIVGGYQAKTTRYGENSHAAGYFAAAGDAQHTTLVARKTTTDATANQVLFLDNSSARLTIPAKTTWTFSIKLSAYNDTDSAAAGWIYRGVIKRDGSNNTSLVGSVIEENWKDSAMNSATSSVVADDTNEALEIRVTGIASKNIRWVAVVDLSQVSYGTP